jgi:hypothetical protein
MKTFKPTGAAASGHFKPNSGHEGKSKTEFTDGHGVKGAHHVGHPTGHQKTESKETHTMHRMGPK